MSVLQNVVLLLDSAVRPTITIGLVVAQIGLAVAWAYGVPHAEQAFAALGAFTMMVVTYWFKARDEVKRTEDIQN